MQTALAMRQHEDELREENLLEDEAVKEFDPCLED